MNHMLILTNHAAIDMREVVVGFWNGALFTVHLRGGIDFTMGEDDGLSLIDWLLTNGATRSRPAVSSSGAWKVDLEVRATKQEDPESPPDEKEGS